MSSDLVFQAIAWHAEDFDFTEIDQEEDKYLDHTKYTIKCFGNTADGKTVSVTIKNFTPYFYVRIDESWDRTKINAFIEDISNLLPNHLKGSLMPVKFMKRKDFWGFTNFREFPFVRICLKNIKTMRFLARKLSEGCVMKKSCGMRTSKFKIYESNIDPYIRFMHCKDIDPCGWIRISSGKYTQCDEVLPTHCDIDVETKWQSIEKYDCVDTAPFLVASFDIECMSLSGDFPVPKKDYKTLASDLYELYYQGFKDSSDEVRKKYAIENAMFHAFNMNIAEGAKDQALIEKYVRKLDPKFKIEPSYIRKIVKQQIDDIFIIVLGKPPALPGRDKIIGALNAKLSNESLGLPELKGDSVIQIGTTFHKYGAKECFMRHIVTLGSCDPIEGVIVESCETEEELLLKWRDLIIRTNPDILTGYNIFGFDMLYMYERANDLGVTQQFMKLGRFKDRISAFKEAKLSSSALGDNFLKYVAMEGRVLIDLMKVIQRDHKLDSYKLDNVASHFMKMNKKDVSPKDIFRLQLGSAQDRMVIADYCIQDCALCNHLMMKLEIIANNMGMANVCLVPLEFIFMRGQGIKIFSLVLKQCKDDGLLIPVVKPAIKKENPEEGGAEGEEEEESYEGAIVLEPKEGIYIDDPVSVLDYASLYPSSMISENLSHDCIVNDPAYDNLPGVEYLDVCYDEYEGVGDKKRKKGVKTVKFVQLPNGEKGIIPRILMKLLKARKTTRKKIGMNLVKMKDGRVFQGFYNEDEHTVVSMESGDKTDVNPDEIECVEDYYNEFQKAVLDGLQNAYKVTANSLYGQIGARTSPIYLKDIAACTTATGRKMILMARDFLEKHYDAIVIYGDTDSLFVIFPNKSIEATIDIPHEVAKALKGKSKIVPSIQTAIAASKEFKQHIKPPHDAEYEKTFWPFILLSKKRYVGNLYEMDDKKFKQKSMGIVLKRRDNAPIVKHIYGGIIDIILSKQDIGESITFLNKSLDDLVGGKSPLEDLVITKSLRAEYKDPTRIAHKVLAERIGERDPGNKPQVNDRIPFVYIQQPPPTSKNAKILQGERIEHPDYIREHKLKPDYTFYITNQIMKPILQVYGIVADQVTGIKHKKTYYDELYAKCAKEHKDDIKKIKDKYYSAREADVKEALFEPILLKLMNKNNKQTEITSFFKVGG
jgi:DNA polymerase elongation subunit (family B)